jgi:hypothetical protein
VLCDINAVMKTVTTEIPDFVGLARGEGNMAMIGGEICNQRLASQLLAAEPRKLTRADPKNHRDRQQPPRFAPHLCLLRKPAGRVVRPNCNSLANGNPLGCHLESRCR